MSAGIWLRTGIFLGVAVGAPAPPGAAQCDLARLAPGSTFDTEWRSIAADGKFLVIGKPTGNGRVFIYERDTHATTNPFDDTWGFVTEFFLEPTQPQVALALGADVALRDEWAFAVARNDNSIWGGAWIYRRSNAGTWTEHALLQAETPELDYAISGDVATSGAWVALSAQDGYVNIFRQDDAGTPDDPVDDVFIRHAVLQVGRQGTDALISDLALQGDILIVGMSGEDTPTTFNSGAATVVERSDSGTPDDLSDDVWGVVARLSRPPAAQLQFGASVDLEGDVAVIGAPGEDPAGAAFVYRRDTVSGIWSELQRLVPEDATSGSRVGTSVVIEDRRIAVGGPVQSAAEGGAWIYGHPAADPAARWVELEQVVPSAIAETPSNFGQSLDFGGELLYVADTNEVFPYTIECPWTTLDGQLEGLFFSATLRGSGLLADDTLLTVELSGLPPAGNAFLVFGASRIDAPFQGGVLIPEPTVVLAVPLPKAIGFQGRWPAGAPTGTTLYWQVWNFDPLGIFPTVATNAAMSVSP